MNCEFCKFTEICTKLSYSSQMIEFRLKNQNLSKSHKLFQSLPRVNLDDGKFSGVLQNHGGTESWAGLGTWIQGEDFFSLEYFMFDMKMKTFAGMMAIELIFIGPMCTWDHLVTKFLTNASGATLWLNFQQMHVVPSLY